MDTTRSAKDYIKENDFEGAKERFEKSERRWRKHWYNTCLEIARKVRFWLRKYVFDPIALTIRELTEADQVDEPCTYLIRMYDEDGEYTYLKAGKAKILEDRLQTLRGKHYKRENIKIGEVEVIKTWKLPTEHLAEAFEQVVHHYLSTIYNNIPNDRYDPVELTEEQFAEIDRRYEMMTAFF